MKGTTKKVSIATIRTRKLLMESLFTLLEKKNFESISTTEICDLAMVPRATFYNHFKDKYDLLRFCIQHWQSRIMPLDEEIGPYTEDYYNRIMKNVVSYINSNMPAFKRIGRANNNGVIFTELQKYISGTIKSHLEKIRLQNVEFSVPPEVIAEFYSSAIVFLGKWWVENGLIYSEAEIALYIHKLLHGEYYVNHNE